MMDHFKLDGLAVGSHQGSIEDILMAEQSQSQGNLSGRVVSPQKSNPQMNSVLNSFFMPTPILSPEMAVLQPSTRLDLTRIEDNKKKPAATLKRKEPSFSMPVPNLSPGIATPPPSLNLKKEFKDLQTATEKMKFNYLPMNSSCRFPDVSCPKHTLLIPSDAENEIYLHANTINVEGRTFIAAQYPLYLEKFWGACFEHASLIVDLTNFGDSMKDSKLFEFKDIPSLIQLNSYAPREGQFLSLDSVQVTCLGSQDLEEGKGFKYRYKIEKNGKTTEVDRLHFMKWDDQKGTDVKAVKVLIEAMKPYMTKTDSNRAPLVHCRAGIGRTGSVITCCILEDLIGQKKVNQENLLEKTKQLILEGRAQRNPNYVQTETQLETILKFGENCLNKKS